MHTTGGHRQYPRAKMPGAGSVVGRVADHDELRGLKLLAEMLVDSLRGDRRQIAPIKRRVAERSGKFEELRQPRQLQLQVSGRFDVAGEQGRSITWMFGDPLQDFATPGDGLDQVPAISSRALHLFNIASE